MSFATNKEKRRAIVGFKVARERVNATLDQILKGEKKIEMRGKK